jgi:putative exporter of polyketide antibiotics
MAARNESISGNFWGAVATYVILVAITTLVGIIMALQGLQPRSGRMTVYFLYMAFLLVIMPGLFSLLRGRDDRSAGIAFAVLAFFNASTSISMITRELSGPWVETP